MGKPASVSEQMKKQTSFTPAEYLRLHKKKKKIPPLPAGMILVNTKEYAERTSNTVEQVQRLCLTDSIEYVYKQGKEWRIGVWK